MSDENGRPPGRWAAAPDPFGSALSNQYGQFTFGAPLSVELMPAVT